MHNLYKKKEVLHVQIYREREYLLTTSSLETIALTFARSFAILVISFTKAFY